MSVNPRANPDTNTKTKYPQEHPSTLHDMQVLLMDLQSLSSTTATHEIEHDKIADKLIMTALCLNSIDRQLRIKCLHLAYLFVQPNIKVTTILGEWPGMMQQILRVRPTLVGQTSLSKRRCLELIDNIVSLMTTYTHTNTGYNPNSSVPSNNHQQWRNWHHEYDPYVPPPRGVSPHGTVYASSISTQEDR